MYNTLEELGLFSCRLMSLYVCDDMHCGVQYCTVWLHAALRFISFFAVYVMPTHHHTGTMGTHPHWATTTLVPHIEQRGCIIAACNQSMHTIAIGRQG